MSTINAVKNKAQGKAKQIKGTINQQRGKGLKGGIQKIEGKTQEKIGDIEIDFKTHRNEIKEDNL
jgi:uncharacterized protein YjbJ (UPF0337 family)